MSDSLQDWLNAIHERHKEMERLYGKRPWKPGGWTQNVQRDFSILRVFFRPDCNGLVTWVNHYLHIERAGEDRGADQWEQPIGGFQTWSICQLIPQIDWWLNPLTDEEEYKLDLWDGEMPELITDPERLRFSNEMIASQLAEEIKVHDKASEIFKVESRAHKYPGGWYCYATDSLIFNFEEGDYDYEPVNQFLTFHKQADKIVGMRLDYASKLNREVREHRNMLSRR